VAQYLPSGGMSNAIGILDAMIGQVAIAVSLPLHTFNQKHFKVIPNLITARPYNHS
jgi:predicted nucleic acid-binding protein